MENVIQKAENFKQESLLNFKELTIGKETIPLASCSDQGNPNVLFRCENKVYDDKSNVVTEDKYKKN